MKQKLDKTPFLLQAIVRQIVHAHVSDSLFVNEAMEIGISADDSILYEIISSAPAFKNPDGSFNKVLFENQVKSVFGRVDVYMNNFRNDVIKAQFLNTMVDSIGITKDFVILNLKAFKQIRNFKYVLVTEKEFENNVPKATNKDLQNILNKNLNDFTIKELRNVDFVSVDMNDEVKNIEVNDSEIKAFYEANINSFLSEGGIEMSQILIKDEKEANKIYEEIKNLKIAEVKNKYKVVNLGEVYKKDLPPEISRIAFSSELGKFLQPTKSSIGFHLIYISKKIGRSPTPINKVKDIIIEEIKKEKKNQKLKTAFNTFNSLVMGNKSKEEILKEFKTAKFVSYSVNEDNLNEKGEFINDITKNKEILVEIFKEVEINKNKVLSLSTDNFIGFKINKINPKKVMSLEESKDKLVTIWKKEYASKMLIEKANKLVLEISKDPLYINSLDVKTKSFNKQTKELPPESVVTMFSNSKRFEVIKIIDSNGDTMVGFVVDIINPTDSEIMKDYDKFYQGNLQIYKESVLQEMHKKLTNKYKITVDQKAILDAIFNRQGIDNSLGE
jgi:peptidyl-prolyl cis-trans isomerase D